MFRCVSSIHKPFHTANDVRTDGIMCNNDGVGYVASIGLKVMTELAARFPSGRVRVLDRFASTETTPESTSDGTHWGQGYGNTPVGATAGTCILSVTLVPPLRYPLTVILCHATCSIRVRGSSARPVFPQHAAAPPQYGRIR